MEKKISLSAVTIKYPLVVALITQVLVLLFLRNIFWVLRFSIAPWGFVFLQALLSSLMTQFIFKLPKWFFYISILFPVFFMLALSYLHFNSGLYGVIFLFLALSFSHTLKERVPLYLSNNTTQSTLLKIIRQRKAKKVLDLGSGLGGVVRALSDKEIESVGVESAPLLFLSSWAMSKLQRRGVILRQNIWQTNLESYDLVYAFLSPAIMEKLYEKIQKEMKSGSLFISNSFPVQGVKANNVLELEDERKTKLYFYEIGR